MPLKSETLRQATLRATSSVKIASNKSAADTFKSLYREDAEFRKMVNDRLSYEKKPFMVGEVPNKATKIRDSIGKKVDSGEINLDADYRKMYEAFNIGLVRHDPGTDKAVLSFYDALKKQGYGAINDINDNKYSGYGAKTAAIVIDTDSVVKTAMREIGDKELKTANIRANTAIFGREVAKVLAGYGIGIGGMVTTAKIASTAQTAKIASTAQTAKKASTTQAAKKTSTTQTVAKHNRKSSKS